MPNLTFGDSTPMLITGHDSSTSGTVDTPFVIFGQTGVTDFSCPLSVTSTVNPGDDGGIYLFLAQNYTVIDSTINPVKFFVRAELNYVVGLSYSTSSPMYLFAGNFQCETMNLFIKTDPVPNIGIQTNLSMLGSQGYASHLLIPLFIMGKSVSKSMNLVVKGGDSGGKSRILRFFIEAENPSTDGSTSLFVHNDNTMVEGPITDLFIRGDGQNPGFTPYGEALGMYIARGPNAGITMYLQNSALGVSSPLHIIGAPLTNKSSPMYIKGLGGALEEVVSLTTKGNIFQESDGVSTLVLPKVIGFEPETAYLYVNGFEY